ncbi:LPXTG cell wall anchor domain-containing protein, partial [Pseudoflavonifractor sp. An85]|uniref:LPXTG cell wall anchor domain-containing protein n=1 Tax=Pseudoflavonifractor sp. An85 TaxID=1965661 RepID=UPI000B564A11
PGPTEQPQPSNEPVVTDKPEASQKPETSQKPEATQKPGDVQTGDSTNLIPLFGVLGMCALALTGMVVARKRKH